jgi:Cu/Ag efflux pump CusA
MIHKIIDFSARNKFPVFLLAGVAVAAGWWSLHNVPLDAIPDLSDTQVIIYSRWDRSPDIMEDQVTYPVIAALLGAPHVKDIRGFSDFGYSYVYIIFDERTDVYWVRSRTLEYLSKISSRLPAGVQTELGPDATPSAGSFNTRWWTPRESKAWTPCAPIKTGTCAIISKAFRGWRKWRPSVAWCASTRSRWIPTSSPNTRFP